MITLMLPWWTTASCPSDRKCVWKMALSRERATVIIAEETFCFHKALHQHYLRIFLRIYQITYFESFIFNKNKKRTDNSYFKFVKIEIILQRMCRSPWQVVNGKSCGQLAFSFFIFQFWSAWLFIFIVLWWKQRDIICIAPLVRYLRLFFTRQVSVTVIYTLTWTCDLPP